MLRSCGSWWYVVWYEGTNVSEKYAACNFTFGCLYHKPVIRLHTVTTHWDTILIFTTLETLSPVKSTFVHTHTILCHLKIAVWNFTKVSTSVRANGHQSIKKFTSDGTEEHILQVCHSPTQFLWKNRTQTQSCNSNTYSCVPLTTKFIYEELRYLSFQNSFLLVPFGADLLFKNRHGKTILCKIRSGWFTVFQGITSPDYTGNWRWNEKIQFNRYQNYTSYLATWETSST